MTKMDGAPAQTIPQVDAILCKYPYQKFDIEAWKEEHSRRLGLMYCAEAEDKAQCVDGYMREFEQEPDGNEKQVGMFRSRAGFLQQIEECKKADESGVFEQTDHTITPEERERGAPWVFAIEFTSWTDSSGEKADFFGLYLEGGMK